MAIDPRTYGTRTPRGLDGREYPERLRQYEAWDSTLLPLLAELEPATYNAMDQRVTDPRMHAYLPDWLNSAEWRGLVERVETTSPWTWQLGPMAQQHLSHAA
jgi:hypothetical protein